MGVTIKNVAEAAGVSITTVSQVINKKGKISQKTIDKVNKVAQELGYVANVSASNLRKSKPEKHIVVILDSGVDYAISIPLYRSLKQTLSNQDIETLYIQFEHDIDVLEVMFNFILSNQVLAIIPISIDMELDSLLNKHSKKPLLIGIAFTDVNNTYNTIVINNRVAGVRAARGLLEQRQNQVLMIVEPNDIVGLERVIGFENEMRDIPILYDVVYGFDRSQIQDLLLTGNITSIVCGSTSMIDDVLSLMSALNISIGPRGIFNHKISILGFGDCDNTIKNIPLSFDIISEEVMRMLSEKSVGHKVVISP
ncbi:LacI family transcriptional regulator [Vibrio sp. SS-MA-C1-2]|uniref:LacI family DNA-binding transcriptional regulator n=1 Tax=Vibrio sp. SS-MA-C1-2 TaxID=2908646 RepID=UPI001F480E2D|nr:LacI family DNA-binding transcriptional regulator [Vibrio sp. SS-MA-C1-2]UJF18505.1 LacI family transcriptional regulator [Vibrio sp. SS-MA-C1-2]